MTVDAHAHVIVPEITRAAGAGEPWRPRVFRDDAGEQVVEMGGNEIRSAIAEFVDADAVEGLARARIQNESLAALVRASPERVAALGALPLQDAELAAAELRAL